MEIMEANTTKSLALFTHAFSHIYPYHPPCT